MKRFDEWWFPDDETQLVEAMTTTNVRVRDHKGYDRLTWQYHKYAAAVALLPLDRRRVAVDVGAHVGLWSYWMARDFDSVLACEPNTALHSCFVANMPENGHHVELLHVALSDDEHVGRLEYAAEATGGGRFVLGDPAPGGIITMVLDALSLSTIDLLKVDVEGGEAAVLRGGEQTIRRCKPIIVVEVQQQNAPEDLSAVVLLDSWGASIRTRLGNDVIMEWK